MKTLSALVLAAGLGAVALTGCSGASAPASTSSASSAPSASSETTEAPAASGDQSVEDACATATASVSALQSDLTSISTDVSEGNFTVVAEKLGALNTSLETAAAEISNSEVKGALTTLGEKVGDFAAIFTGVADGDMTAFTTKVEELQTVSQEVATAGQAMTELCS
ncbi:hypothetical protein QL996_00115 [Planococcus sp. APC 4015]|nr:hypothetical protein [Planococcus sp. APC 4015]